MSEQDNILIVKQAYTYFKTGNIQALLDLMSDDITWQVPEMDNLSFSGRRMGRESVREFFSLLSEDQEPLRFEPKEFVAQGDKVVSLGSYDWRVRSNAREYSGDFAHCFTVRNGQITNFHEYMDTAAAVKAHQKAMSA